MKALSIHGIYTHDILTGFKKEEYRTWKPKEKGRILICSSARKYKGCVCGYALCTAEIGNINEYPGEGENGETIYGWELKKIRFIDPFPIKGKLHLFDVDDSLIYESKEQDRKEWFEAHYDKLRNW